MSRSEKTREKEGRCFCPYCEEQVVIAESPFCQPCGLLLRYCIKCQVAVVREATVCPECGGELEWK